MISYQDIDPEIGKAAEKKILSISGTLFFGAFYIFDDNVPTEVKAKIAQLMLEADKDEEEKEVKNQLKRYILHQNDFSSSYINIDLSSFVTPGKKIFLHEIFDQRLFPQ